MACSRPSSNPHFVDIFNTERRNGTGYGGGLHLAGMLSTKSRWPVL